jgi:hypothetical protein
MRLGLHRYCHLLSSIGSIFHKQWSDKFSSKHILDGGVDLDIPFFVFVYFSMALIFGVNVYIALIKHNRYIFQTTAQHLLLPGHVRLPL